MGIASIGPVLRRILHYRISASFPPSAMRAMLNYPTGDDFISVAVLDRSCCLPTDRRLRRPRRPQRSNFATALFGLDPLPYAKATRRNGKFRPRRSQHGRMQAGPQ
jgi:hypothetical protein